MSVIVGIFIERADLERALEALQRRNLADKIGVAAREDVARDLMAFDQREEKSARLGIRLGAVSGGLAGILVGALAVPLGGVPILLAGALAGLGVGAAAGKLTGVVSNQIAQGYDEDVLIEAVRNGHYLLSVEIPDDKDHDISRLLQDHGSYRQVIRPGRLPEDVP